MTNVLPTRVFDCWDALYDLLAAQTWPVHPSTGVKPTVRFSGTKEQALEMITVPGMLEAPNPTAQQEVMGVVGDDETFTLVVHLFSMVPGYVDTTHGGDPSRAVRQRIRDLTYIVLNAVRDPTTGRPAGTQLLALLNVWNWFPSAPAIPAVAPLEQNGFGASCTVRITFQARI